MLRSRQAAPSVDEDREAVVAWLDQVAARVDQLGLTSLPVPASVRQVEVHAPLLAAEPAEPLFEPIVIEPSPEPEPVVIEAAFEPIVIEPAFERVVIEPIVTEPTAVDVEVRGHAHAELRLVPDIEERVVDEPVDEEPAVEEPVVVAAPILIEEPVVEEPVVDEAPILIEEPVVVEEPVVEEPRFTALPTLRSLAADYEPRLEQLCENLRRARGKRDERLAKERLRLLHDEYRAAKRAVRTAG